MKKCENCNLILQDSDAFCPKCGGATVECDSGSHAEGETACNCGENCSCGEENRECGEQTAENVQALPVAAGDVSFTLTPAEGAWTADGRDVTDQLADLTAWLGDMHLAACVDWRPSAGAAALCGLDQPGAVLTAEYTPNGVQHSFTLTVGGQRGAGYCVTVSDDDTIYLMSAEALAPLLALAQTGLA